MAGGCQDPQANVAEAQLIAGREVVLVRILRARGAVRDGPGRGGEAHAAAEVVGVVVSVDHVGDPQPLLAGDVEVDVDVEPRVHDHCLAGVADDVGRTSEVLVEHLSEVHGEPPCGLWLIPQ